MHRWTWRGVYKDGTSVSELDTNPKTGLGWSSAHLDYPQLDKLVLEPKDGSGQKHVVIKLNEGEEPIRFWRHYHNAMSDERGTCHILGVKKGEYSFYVFLRPDGSIVISTDSEASEVGI